MDETLRQSVRRRAKNCCEYCRLPQEASPFLRFHIEHVIARQHGGATKAGNLALACSSCNLHKGPNVAGIDAESDSLARLFNPRTDVWAEHFAWNGVEVVGLTAIGRVTADVLAMNNSRRLDLRDELNWRGEEFAR